MNYSSIRHPASGIQHSGSSIQTVAVIGEGKMGTSIFYSLFNRSYSLYWIVSQDANLEKLQQAFEKKVHRALKTGIMNQDEHDVILQQTIITLHLNDAFDSDLVIEAIPEELSAKQTLFRTLDNIIKPAGILASNSSSIAPSKLFTGTARDERIIGIHYFYPVPIKDFVELISTSKTASGVIELTEFFLTKTGKSILKLNESNSFILNRLFLNIQNEAFKLTEHGKASEEQVDLLVKEHLFPIGIFEFMDSVGIDTMHAAVLNYISDYPNPDAYSGLVNKLHTLIDEGKLGIKTGQGFYLYKDGHQAFPGDPHPLSPQLNQEIIDFLRFTYLSTAKRFTMQSGCTIEEMNNAIKEYLGIDKGPFE